MKLTSAKMLVVYHAEERRDVTSARLNIENNDRSFAFDYRTTDLSDDDTCSLTLTGTAQKVSPNYYYLKGGGGIALYLYLLPETLSFQDSEVEHVLLTTYADAKINQAGTYDALLQVQLIFSGSYSKVEEHCARLLKCSIVQQ